MPVDICNVLWTALLAVLVPMAGTIDAPKVHEFCQWEPFQPSCGENEVVIMDVAEYGRMNLGRCITTDFGYVGCSTDVLDIADRMCSGRQKCEIQNPNPTFSSLKPCLTDLTSYFEASYHCQPVIPASMGMCQTANFVKVKASQGFLSNAVTMATKCGSVTSPWILEGMPGQRINITLWDFNVEKGGYVGGTACKRYATLIEDDPKRNKLVCGGSIRKNFIYTSMRHRLEVRIHSNQFAPSNQPYFMLHFKVFGCSDPQLPNFAWYKREGDVATIGCTGGSERWRLVCKDNVWEGDVGVCDGGASLDPARTDFVVGRFRISYSTTIAVIIAISIAIGVLILTVGLYCMRRQKQINQRKRATRENEAYRELAYADYNKQVADNTLNERHSRYRDTNSYPRPKKNEYASIRDWPLPPPPIESAYEKNKNGGYFQSSYGGNGIQTEDYLASTGSGSENIYQMPEVSDGSIEECPRYFELDPGVSVVTPGKGLTSDPCPGYTANTGTGVGHGSELNEARYSN